MSLGNTNRTKIHKMLGDTSANQKVTGSIYKICATDGDAIIASGHNDNHLSCLEADFSAVSSSNNTLIFYKGNLR